MQVSPQRAFCTFFLPLVPCNYLAPCTEPQKTSAFVTFHSETPQTSPIQTAKSRGAKKSFWSPASWRPWSPRTQVIHPEEHLWDGVQGEWCFAQTLNLLSATWNRKINLLFHPPAIWLPSSRQNASCLVKSRKSSAVRGTCKSFSQSDNWGNWVQVLPSTDCS